MVPFLQHTLRMWRNGYGKQVALRNACGRRVKEQRVSDEDYSTKIFSVA